MMCPIFNLYSYTMNTISMYGFVTTNSTLISRKFDRFQNKHTITQIDIVINILKCRKTRSGRLQELHAKFQSFVSSPFPSQLNWNGR